MLLGQQAVQVGELHTNALDRCQNFIQLLIAHCCTAPELSNQLVLLIVSSTLARPLATRAHILHISRIASHIIKSVL